MQEKQPGREQGLFVSPERQGLEWFLQYEAVPKAWFVAKWLWFVEKWVVGVPRAQVGLKGVQTLYCCESPQNWICTNANPQV